MKLENEKHDWDLRSSYSLNLKKSAVLTLLIFNLLFFLFPKFNLESPEPDMETIITIDVENIPATRQTKQASPPPKPSVPIPTDDESIPEDDTIEETDLKYANIFDYTTSTLPGMTGLNVTPPRPVAWVFPEFPESEKNSSVQGIVKLSIHVNERGQVTEVVVLENTTGSLKCSDAAVAAAYGSRFLPAKYGGKAVSFWITQPYRFDIRN